MSVRPAAVSGRFYPADPAELARSVDVMLAGAGARTATGAGAEPPKAIVAPHAGYVYSGPVAATAYAQLATARDLVTRVVLLGPAHRTPVACAAVPSVDAFHTPLGPVQIDAGAREVVAAMPGVVVDDEPHASEHSLEVHLPFLQRTLSSFRILPIAVGRADPDVVANVLEALWGGPETLVVVSTDLSHYEQHDAAARHDRETARAILTGTVDTLDGYDACGVSSLRGLVAVAGRRRLRPRLLDLRTSGDTAGRRDSVVGYGAFAFTGST